MPYVLGLLTTVITILYLLDRLGIDLGGFNPFYWRRRRAWAKKYEGDPIYAIEDPIHVAALMVVGFAKLGGDLSAEQKKAAQATFESNFSLDARAASELLNSAAYLLGGPQIIDRQLDGLADRNKGRFTRDQARSLVEMMSEVASAGGDPTREQSEYMARIRSEFVPQEEAQGTWA